MVYLTTSHCKEHSLRNILALDILTLMKLFMISAAHPVGSSIMLLGGFGFLSRLHGLSVDNLVEVEMVLADGRIVIVNENDHPGLWSPCSRY